MAPTAGRQALESLVPGTVAGVVVALTLRPSFGPLAGFDAAALFYVGRVWHKVWRLDAESTAEIAAREDPMRAVADLVLLIAALLSLGAVIIAILQSHHAQGTNHDVEVALGAASIAISWLLVHTIFALKYARLYYGGAGDEGGVEFENRVRPPYSDFAYLSFTIGMTFQVSDTDLQTAAFRRLALRHALLSYLFGAIILGVSINLVASLVS